jgi:hypothetical protein
MRCIDARKLRLLCERIVHVLYGATVTRILELLARSSGRSIISIKGSAVYDLIYLWPHSIAITVHLDLNKRCFSHNGINNPRGLCIYKV